LWSKSGAGWKKTGPPATAPSDRADLGEDSFHIEAPGVTRTELEHGPPNIAELLEAVIHRLAPPLEVQEVEGDAVFTFGLDRAVHLGEVRCFMAKPGALIGLAPDGA
jgi:hypothetical protein